MDTIVKIRFGSHLYGTNTENSDMDYKGIYLPDMRNVILQNVEKSISTNTKVGNGKNTKDDIDSEMYSLQYFMKMLMDGQTVALDMLFANDENIVETSDIWREICNNREMFIHKNTKAFVGYCRTQAAKYGIKGSRICAIKTVVKSISEIMKKTKMVQYIRDDGYEWTKSSVREPVYNKLKDCFEELPVCEHVTKYMDKISRQMIYEICGRKFQESCELSHVLKCLNKILDNYGQRARMAENNENIDWKAISHAFRVCYEIKELLKYHKITFPLKEAEFIKDIKQGKMHYKKDMMGEKLETLMQEVEDESKKSTLPEMVEQKVYDDFIVKIYTDVIRNEKI